MLSRVEAALSEPFSSAQNLNEYVELGQVCERLGQGLATLTASGVSEKSTLAYIPGQLR